jgi:hypothetical protein
MGEGAHVSCAARTLVLEGHISAINQSRYYEGSGMHAKIKGICGIDGGDLTIYRPSESDRFAVVLRLLVGPSSGEGEESFDVSVCTPSWLDAECERTGFVLGRHYLIVRSYDFEFIRRTLIKSVERYRGATWQEVADKVSRIGYWEFEDYERVARG